MEDPEAGPALREQFRGFTEYTNNVGALPMTTLAVPNLLTGVYPDGTESMSDYAWSCYGAKSVLRDYLEAGSDVFVTTPQLGCGYTTRTNRPMVVSVGSASVLSIPGNGGNAWSIRDFTRWRWMPFGAKALVSDLTGRVAQNGDGDMREWGVYKTLANAGINPSNSGTFLWIHTTGVHLPICWNRRGEILPSEDPSDHGCVEQGVFVMGVLGNLLDAYRKAGIYDNSLILVLGDHGSEREAKKIDDQTANRLPGNARPCLWVKPMGSRHEFRSDATPTSHARVAELLRAASRQRLSEEEISALLQSDKRVYRWIAVLGNSWVDWVVDRNGDFAIEERTTSLAASTNVPPLQSDVRYSLSWQQVKDREVGVVFRNVEGGSLYPYLSRDTQEASFEFRVPNPKGKYALRLDLYLSRGGSLRARCDAPGAEWEEFPVQVHGAITLHGVSADSSGIARILIERAARPHVDVSFTGLLISEEQ